MVKAELNQQYQQTPNVHKFGGSSLKDAVQIAKVVETIRVNAKAGDFIVVSANGHVTDSLMAFLAGSQHVLIDLEIYLNQLIESVLQKPKDLLKAVKRDLSQLSEQTKLIGSAQHEILAMGELWSAQLLSLKLAEEQMNNDWLDARDFLVIDEQNNLANKSIARKLFMQAVNQCTDSVDGKLFNVITGFIASDLTGKAITLGRNGSDYTATLIAYLVKSVTVFLWTDVDGVYSADPNVIDHARVLNELTISEAQALSELGSNVLHQKTIAPILQKSISLVINACDSGSSGTVVKRKKSVGFEIKSGRTHGTVKTLAYKSGLVFLSLSQINELKARQFQTQLTAKQINNYANHYDKTQYELSFYIEDKDLFETTQLIKSADLKLKSQQTGISLISAVGQNIRQNHRVITKLLNRSAQFTVHNIHYPANDHTLCVLLSDEQGVKLLRDLHQTFFILEPSIPIVVLGYGNIGKQFLRILKINKEKIEENVNKSLSVVAVANSRYFQFNESCLLDQNITLDQPNHQGELVKVLQKYAGKPAIIIDLTASEWVAKQCLGFAENGWHLISANKIAAANKSWAESIEYKLQQNDCQWRKNTTVGAALPIQQAIRQIKASGDQVKQVAGVFSGSLSWLFGQYDGDVEFMQWVKQAHENAYTEPDPREDLSGQDVYRKALILAKELDFMPEQVKFKPAIPEEYLAGTVKDFWNNHKGINHYIKSLWAKAESKNQQLCYLATVSADELCVELVAIDDTHSAAALKPGDNIFIIESNWYSDNPLVIQGPGAGREVTAAGVLTDLIEVLK